MLDGQINYIRYRTKNLKCSNRGQKRVTFTYTKRLFTIKIIKNQKTSISCINVKRNLDPVDFKKEPKWRFDLGSLEASRLGMLQKYLFITLEIEFGCKYSLSSIWSLSIWEEGRLLLIMKFIIQGVIIFIYGNYFITIKLVFVQKQYISCC